VIWFILGVLLGHFLTVAYMVWLLKIERGF